MEAASTEAAAARSSVAFLSNPPPRERRLLEKWVFAMTFASHGLLGFKVHENILRQA
jgi:hypothetical protein